MVCCCPFPPSTVARTPELDVPQVFLPAWWGHATRNFGDTVGYGVEYLSHEVLPFSQADSDHRADMRSDTITDQQIPRGFLEAHQAGETSAQRSRAAYHQKDPPAWEGDSEWQDTVNNSEEEKEEEEEDWDW